MLNWIWSRSSSTRDCFFNTKWPLACNSLMRLLWLSWLSRKGDRSVWLSLPYFFACPPTLHKLTRQFSASLAFIYRKRDGSSRGESMGLPSPPQLKTSCFLFLDLPSPFSFFFLACFCITSVWKSTWQYTLLSCMPKLSPVVRTRLQCTHAKHSRWKTQSRARITISAQSIVWEHAAHPLAA